MSLLDVKIIRNEKVDPAEEVNLKVTVDGRGERIFVQYNCESPRLCIQKNYPNTFAGRSDAEDFSKKITSLADMKAYFRIKE